MSIGVAHCWCTGCIVLSSCGSGLWHLWFVALLLSSVVMLLRARVSWLRAMQCEFFTFFLPSILLSCVLSIIMCMPLCFLVESMSACMLGSPSDHRVSIALCGISMFSCTVLFHCVCHSLNSLQLMRTVAPVGVPIRRLLLLPAGVA